MKKPLAFFATGALLALLVSFAAISGAYEHYRFRINYSLKAEETAVIEKTIRFFSSTVAGLYATGGIVTFLNIFPAEAVVKHRLFQDIGSLKAAGKLLVMDRDKSTFRKVTFIRPDRVIAVVDENWFSVYQDYKTRRQISEKKANLVTVRYFLQKKWGKWIVADYDVYPQGLTLPQVPEERMMSW